MKCNTHFYSKVDLPHKLVISKKFLVCLFYFILFSHYICTRNKNLRSCSRIWDVALWDEPNIELERHSVHSQYSVWPLAASITIDVKNNHAYVTTQGILGKFKEINFSVGWMVCPWWCLSQHGLPVKIMIRFSFFAVQSSSTKNCRGSFLSHLINDAVHDMKLIKKESKKRNK